MTYTIFFENKADAENAAQEVRVTNPLDPRLDWSTFEMLDVVFADQVDTGLLGKRYGTSEVTMNGTAYKVRTKLSLDEERGVADWYLRIVDEMSETTWPDDVFAGFLQPNDPDTHCGEGHLTYRIKLREDAEVGTVISNAATIVFDYNEAIETDPAWWNTIVLPGMNFDVDGLSVDEGGNIMLAVSGGDAEKAANVQVYLTYQTAAAADLDLAKGAVDGATPKGGLKFPLTLSWKKGDTASKTITIPVKADKTVEDDETLVFQLAAAQGQEIGEVSTCTVTIRDANVAADYAAKQAIEKAQTKKGVETNALTVACCAADGSGDMCGYTAGQGKYSKGSKASLKATARPGWEFKGWGEVFDAVTNIVSDKASWNVMLTNDAEIVAVFERIPYVAGLASPADGGKVAGSGYCAAGKKVTLKATANKNFAFVGWVTNDCGAGDAVGTTASTVITTPTLVFDRSAKPAKSDAKQTVITNVNESVTYYAVFKSDPEVFVNASCDDETGAELTGKGAGKYVAGTVTGAGKYAAGKTKIALKATANKGYVFRGWYGVPSDDVPSVLSVPYVASADPTAVDGCELLSLSATYTLPKMPTNDVELVAAFIMAETDKANIAAQVDGFALEPWVSKTETHAFATNMWAGVYLEWPVAASALSETKVKVTGLPSGLKFVDKPVTSKVGSGKTAVTITNVPANTIYGAPSAASKTTKAKDGTVTVTPSAVLVTVTTAGKSTQTYQIDATVDPLPNWAVGTFAGPSYDRGRDGLHRVGEEEVSSSNDAAGTHTLARLDGSPSAMFLTSFALRSIPASTNGAVSVTIATSGKITAKQPVDGKAVSFTANWFDWYDAANDAFWATLTAKSGTAVLTNEMVVCGHAGRVTLPDVDGGMTTLSGGVVVTNGVIGAERFDAWQYDWKNEPWKTIGKSFDKQVVEYWVKADGTFSDDAMGAIASTGLGDEYVAKVTLKFAASGAVTVAGEFVVLDADGQPVYKNKKLQTVKATGSATMLPQSDADGALSEGDEVGDVRYRVFVYLAPKGLSPHARFVELQEHANTPLP